MTKKIFTIVLAFLPIFVFAQRKTIPGGTQAPVIAVTAVGGSNGPEINILPASLNWSGDSSSVEGRYDIKFIPKGSNAPVKHNMSFFANGVTLIGANDVYDATLMDSLQIEGSPEFKLFVSEGIRTEQVKVDLKTAWPDYVFENDYDVPTLEDTKSYIEEHKHLQNVPSAAEVKQKGINLGEMDAILLRKLEEMTLQMIEMNERLKKLEEENRQLKENK